MSLYNFIIVKFEVICSIFLLFGNLKPYLSFTGRCNIRVSRLADDVRHGADWSLWNAGKGLVTVVGEVAIDLPRLAKVVRPLEQHGSRTEGLETHHQVGEVKLGAEIQLNVGVLNAILCLPPLLLPVFAEGRHDIFDSVALCRRAGHVGIARVAHEAFFRVFQVADDAVSLGLVQTTR